MNRWKTQRRTQRRTQRSAQVQPPNLGGTLAASPWCQITGAAARTQTPTCGQCIDADNTRLCVIAHIAGRLGDRLRRGVRHQDDRESIADLSDLRRVDALAVARADAACASHQRQVNPATSGIRRELSTGHRLIPVIAVGRAANTPRSAERRCTVRRRTDFHDGVP